MKGICSQTQLPVKLAHPKYHSDEILNMSGMSLVINKFNYKMFD